MEKSQGCPETSTHSFMWVRQIHIYIYMRVCVCVCVCVCVYTTGLLVFVSINFPVVTNLGHGVTAWKFGEIHDIMVKHWHLFKKNTISNYNLEHKPHAHIVLSRVIGKSWNIYMYWLLFIASSKVLHELTGLCSTIEGERIRRWKASWKS